MTSKVKMTLIIAKILQQRFPDLGDVEAINIAHTIVEAITSE
jgi:hypothetical protein